MQWVTVAPTPNPFPHLQSRAPPPLATGASSGGSSARLGAGHDGRHGTNLQPGARGSGWEPSAGSLRPDGISNSETPSINSRSRTADPAAGAYSITNYPQNPSMPWSGVHGSVPGLHDPSGHAAKRQRRSMGDGIHYLDVSHHPFIIPQVRSCPRPVRPFPSVRPGCPPHPPCPPVSIRVRLPASLPVRLHPRPRPRPAPTLTYAPTRRVLTLPSFLTNRRARLETGAGAPAAAARVERGKELLRLASQKGRQPPLC